MQYRWKISMLGRIARASMDEHGMTWYATTAHDLEVAIRGFGFQAEPVILKDLPDLDYGSPRLPSPHHVA